MKSVQKLEMFAGAITFFLTLFNVYLTYDSFSKWIQESRISTQEVLVPAFIFLILPAFLLAASTYFHVVKSSQVGLIIIFIFGGILVVTHLLGLLLGNAFNGYRLLGISPGLFAFTTIIITIINTISARKLNGVFS